jgi:hypothetical protein
VADEAWQDHNLVFCQRTAPSTPATRSTTGSARSRLADIAATGTPTRAVTPGPSSDVRAENPVQGFD